MFLNKKESFLMILVFLFLGFYLQVSQSSVGYDRKALVINGHRRILISGSIHYPRSTPEVWEDLILKAKEGGIDVIDTYVFWNGHEPSPGQYNFKGRYDLVRFIKTVQKAGLYANLRIGPYVCAEWNFGGFPVWLKYVPGISFRTDNEPFKREMQRFTENIVGLMKSHNLYESQGGPIILSQIENEYGKLSKLFGKPGYDYLKWAANMAVQTHTGVPWMMCKQDNAPDPMIDTCNGYYCNEFTPNQAYKPTMWTEAWTGWFTEFGGPIYERPAQDLAFAVAQFIQRGGSFINYYMYHGGTNFGRTAGGPFITTSYDYDAPLDEYGLPRQPKYSHLKELHKAIKLCEHALVSADPIITSLGPLQEAHVYSPEKGGCAAFISNYDKDSGVKVLFNNKHYSIPPWSISILPDCKHVAFNTAKVGAQTTHMRMVPTNAQLYAWQSYNEDADASSMGGNSVMTTFGLLDQINVTRDTSDYLWYKTSVDISSTESFLHGGEQPELLVQSLGHAVHVFVNGKLIGSTYGTRKHKKFSFKQKVNLRPGANDIALLSIAVGLPNVGSHFETWSTGILGPVIVYGLDKGRSDLTWQKWTYQVGLKGESMKLASPTSVSNVEWMASAIAVQQPQPLMWHRAYFDAPEGDEPLALDMKSMGKGQIWVNGQSIGRYWTALAQGECGVCDYVGQFHRENCQHGCGKPTQRWYHVPRSWLKPGRNLLVIFEELGGNPMRITLRKRVEGRICAEISEYHPDVRSWRVENDEDTQEFAIPKAHLSCAADQYIAAISFASFGKPLGTCGDYQEGSCHASDSKSVLEKKCVGRQSCAVAITNSNFGEDPCPNTLKRFSVEAICQSRRR